VRPAITSWLTGHLPSAGGFQPLQRAQPDGGRKVVEVEFTNRRHGRVERVEDGSHLRWHQIEPMFEHYYGGYVTNHAMREACG
jgi:hypothetical protein